MRYADLKAERDEAIRQAVEAVRYSRKEEVDRLERELEESAEREGRLAGELYLTRLVASHLAAQHLNLRRSISATLENDSSAIIDELNTYEVIG